MVYIVVGHDEKLMHIHKNLSLQAQDEGHMMFCEKEYNLDTLGYKAARKVKWFS